MEQQNMHKPIQSQKINYFNFLKMYPNTIKSMHVHNNLLLISRQNYTEIHSIVNYKGKYYFDQLLRLEPTQHIFQINNSIVLVTLFQIKICNFQIWKTHPFTSQLTSITFIDDQLYTHHQNSTLLWDIENMTYQTISSKQIPFHRIDEGVKGHLKTIKGPFTFCHQFNENLYIGHKDGTISIYQMKFFTMVKQLKKHEGPILSIISCKQTNSVYATGCDSKIVCIKKIKDDFLVTSSCRGQSHDILSLCLINKQCLISGGLSTDICYYHLKNGDFIDNFENRVSLPSKKLIQQSSNNFLLVNQIKHLELWNYNTLDKISEYVFKFETNAPINQISLSQNGKWIGYSTSNQTVILKKNEQNQVTKHITLKSCLFINFIQDKNKAIVVAEDLFVYNINLKTKQIKQLFRIQQIFFPSNFQIQANILVIGSKLQQKILAYDLKKQQKINQLKHKYHYLELNQKGLLITHDFNVYLYLNNGQVLELNIPLRKVRFGGFLPSRKNIWYGVGDANIVLVSSLFSKNERHIKNEEKKINKKIRMQNIKRAYQIIRDQTCLNIVPINFSQMISQIENPIITKKIF